MRQWLPSLDRPFRLVGTTKGEAHSTEAARRVCRPFRIDDLEMDAITVLARPKGEGG